MIIPFKVGDRVRMGPDARAVFKIMRDGADEGIVMAVYLDRQMIQVLRGGLKTKESWSWNLWELMPGGAAQ